jgi:3-carboxy-cis,cis-muconate cycloisomerase
MPASLMNSQIYGGLFGDPETERLFSDTAELRALLLVEGALARVQGSLGLIPTEAAAFIDRAAHTAQIDPAALAADTARNGVPVPALLAAFRNETGAADHMQFLHWGATSQDIMDTGLALRLRPVLDLWQTRLDGLLMQLASLADAHADQPMAARTYGQVATPTSFGAVVAAWGWPLVAAGERLAALRPAVLQVSLSGAAGTLSAMGPLGPDVRAALAQTLKLSDPGRSWHTDRSGIGALSGFAATLAATVGKIGEDLILMTQSGLAEVTLGAGGASSTMPQKENPVAPSAIVALARFVIGQAAILQGSGLHRQQRDGTAWFTEWLTLPQSCIALGRMLTLAQDCLSWLQPDPAAMATQMDAGNGSILAEALTFALALKMPRPEAERVVRALLAEASASGLPFVTHATRTYPDLAWPEISAASLGQAPKDARHFARMVRDMQILPDAASGSSSPRAK